MCNLNTRTGRSRGTVLGWIFLGVGDTSASPGRGRRALGVNDDGPAMCGPSDSAGSAGTHPSASRGGWCAPNRSPDGHLSFPTKRAARFLHPRTQFRPLHLLDGRHLDVPGPVGGPEQSNGVTSIARSVGHIPLHLASSASVSRTTRPAAIRRARSDPCVLGTVSARSGTRTRTPFRTAAFEAAASAIPPSGLERASVQGGVPVEGLASTVGRVDASAGMV